MGVIYLVQIPSGNETPVKEYAAGAYFVGKIGGDPQAGRGILRIY